MATKLLLADDSVTIQRVIELTFADEDIRVIAVGDGQQAIEAIEREHPDIVLADIGMPERDGYEVVAFVKRHATLGHVPVVLLAGAFEPVDEARARDIGCDGVLVKPFRAASRHQSCASLAERRKRRIPLVKSACCGRVRAINTRSRGGYARSRATGGAADTPVALC